MEEGSMRLYQKELSIRAKEGENTIVFAPEGGGKSRVAVDIILDHLEKRVTSKRGTCVFYLVNSSLRRNKIEEFISQHNIPYVAYGGGDIGDEVALKTLMKDNHVIILTAQVLLNLLGAENPHKLTLEELSLMVFDECHRASKEHCYNSIMRHYLKAQNNQPDIRLPQVVGFTSTLNVGPRDDMKRAEFNVKRICANLAAEALSVVIENADELGRCLPTVYPVMEELEIPQREDDPCHRIIAEHMKNIHEKMAQIHDQKTDEITGRKKERLERSLKNLPEDFGSPHYNRWIRKMKFSVQTIKNCPLKQQLICYSGYLIMYNQALIINAQARTEDALSFLKEDIYFRRDFHQKAVDTARQQQGQSLPREVEEANRWLEQEYSSIEKRLGDKTHAPNPMLALLKEKLQELSQDSAARGIFVVETNAAPQRLQQWMQSDLELRKLSPVVMSGDLQAVDDPSLRILITSVGKERGMPKCTWVIRLMYSTKRIEVIRVKAGPSNADATWSYSELVSGAVLNQAAVKISQMENASFKQAMEGIQRDEMKRIEKQLEKEETVRDDMSKTYKLHCLRCNTFVCNSTELRVHNTNHRTSITRELSSLYKRKPHPKPVAYRDIVINEKLHCGKCEQDWGNFARIMDLWMPVLKPEGFVFVFSREHATYKTWKQVPVNIKPLENVEKDIMREQYG